MVAVEMRDKNITDSGKRQPVTPQLQLCALGAVDEHQFVAVPHRLGTGIVPECRSGGAAA